MASPWRVLATEGFLLLGFCCGIAGARHQDSEAELLARIQRTTDPVKRARFEIRLGRLKLEQTISAYQAGHIEQAERLVGAYSARMMGAWETLQRSGRDAAHHPSGFKELDIELREDARLLEDLAHRVGYENRAPVEKVKKEIEEVRAEVLRVLFPGERPHRAKPAPSRGGNLDFRQVG